MSAEVRLYHRAGAFTLDVDFTLAPSGITALFGPSGAGKSTIIHALAGLLDPQAGYIAFGGDVLLDTKNKIFVPAYRRRVGVMFQDARLFPHLSVENNLLYGWRRSGTPASAGDISGIIDLLGLRPLLQRRTRALSGGEKSRVALGRALLSQPRALLLDEPLAALDGARKAEILPYLERLRDETKIPMLYVSHSSEEVARLADKIIVLDAGRIRAEGSIFDITARIDLAEGRERPVPGTVLPAHVTAHDDAHGLSELMCGGQRLIVPKVARAVGQQVSIRIDAQDVMLALEEPKNVSANNILEASVSAIHAGDVNADVQLSWNGAKLVARITRRSLERLELKEGARVFAVIKSVTVGGRGT